MSNLIIIAMTEEEYFGIRQGGMLGKEHVVENLLGVGGFGIVAKCRNIHTNVYSAVKLYKNCCDARQEIDNMKRLQLLDPEKSHIVKYNGFFFHRFYACLNFELLDQSLYHYIKEMHTTNISMMAIRDVVKHVATALTHLAAVGMVHADIKPANVMIVNCNESPLRFKLIDFGLSLSASECDSDVYVGTAGYMSPEVQLGCQFNEAADIWSLGLIAAEMATGRPLYPGRRDYDVLKHIIETQGQFPDSMLERAKNRKAFFNYQADGPTRWRLKTPDEYDHRCTPLPMYIYIESLDDIEVILDFLRGPSREHSQFVDLLKRMLHLDPEQRITALELLQHPFLADTDETTPSDLEQPLREAGEPAHEIAEGQNENDAMQPVEITFMGQICRLVTFIKETFFIPRG